MAESVIASARKGIKESKGNIANIDKNRFIASALSTGLAGIAGGGVAAGAAAGTFDKNVTNYYDKQIDQLNNYTQQLNEERRYQQQMAWEADKLKANFQLDQAKFISQQQNIPLEQSFARLANTEGDYLLAQIFAKKGTKGSKNQIESLVSSGQLDPEKGAAAKEQIDTEVKLKKDISRGKFARGGRLVQKSVLETIGTVIDPVRKLAADYGEEVQMSSRYIGMRENQLTSAKKSRIRKAQEMSSTASSILSERRSRLLK